MPQKIGSYPKKTLDLTLWLFDDDKPYLFAFVANLNLSWDSGYAFWIVADLRVFQWFSSEDWCRAFAKSLTQTMQVEDIGRHRVNGSVVLVVRAFLLWEFPAKYKRTTAKIKMEADKTHFIFTKKKKKKKQKNKNKNIFWCSASMQDLKNRPMLPVLRADWASSGRNPSVGGKGSSSLGRFCMIAM